MKINKILIIFLFAFLIRLIALNQSLWLDEAITAQTVKTLSYSQIISKFSPTDFHPPLYYLFMKFWTNIFGYSETAVRMPSVIFSLVAGYYIYLIAGVWGAVFFLFNPLIVYYSQEARMYMMATMFLTASLYYLLKSLRINGLTSYNQRDGVFFGLFVSLAFLTFYGSIFLIAAILVYLLYKKKYRFFVSSFAILLSAMVLVSPLLLQQLIHSKTALINVKNWSLVMGKANLKDLLLIPIKFSIGRIDFYPKMIYYALAGIWTGFLTYQVANIKYQNDKEKINNIDLYYYSIISTLLLGFGVSFFVPMLQYFRFIYLIPIVAILLSVNRNNYIKWVLITGLTVFSLVYLLLPRFHREDWKSLVASLPKNQPIYMIAASSDPLRYYGSKLIVRDLLTAKPAFGEKSIIVIPYVSELYGLDYRSMLKSNGYKQSNGKSFRGVSFETWIK